MGQGGWSRIRDSELMLLLERPNSPLRPISPYYYTYVQAACIVPAHSDCLRSLRPFQ